MSRDFKGAKYEPGLDVAEIAKRIRVDITEAVKAGALPKGLKVSVRCRRFAGGRAVDIRVKELGLPIYSSEHLAWEIANVPENRRFYTATFPRARWGWNGAANEAMDTLKGILEAYNFDNSDSMTDYFHVNYYGDVSLDDSYRTLLCERAEFEKDPTREVEDLGGGRYAIKHLEVV